MQNSINEKHNFDYSIINYVILQNINKLIKILDTELNFCGLDWK